MSTRGPKRTGNLTAEDVALWRHVARSVRPLPGRALPEPAAPAPPPPRPPAPIVAPPPLRPTSPPPLPPLAPLERKLRQEFERGRRTPDRVLDLHGMTQAAAHTALRGFLASGQARGDRCVLVITGKGARTGTEHAEPGVLRRVVPQWLRLPDLRGLVLGFEEAAQRHGGAGALYIRLRRRAGDRGAGSDL